MVPKLTVGNEDNFFGTKVKHYEIFTYTAAFLFNDVRSIAEKHGYNIEYCDHTTEQYRTHGDRTCRAIEIGEPTTLEETAHGPITHGLPGEFEDWRAKIGELFLQFETKKNEAAKIRDDLRYIAEEITELVESFDDGVEGMEDALETFRHALDDMSRYI